MDKCCVDICIRVYMYIHIIYIYLFIFTYIYDICCVSMTDEARPDKAER